MTTIALESAEQAIADIGPATNAVVQAVVAEHEAREQRDELLQALTDSLIGSPDPSKKQKADGTFPEHSATSAEKAAKATPEYKDAARAALSAECRRITAWSDHTAAVLRAKLAVVAAGGDL